MPHTKPPTWGAALVLIFRDCRAEEVKRNPGCQYRGNITNQTQKTRHLFWLQ